MNKRLERVGNAQRVLGSIAQDLHDARLDESQSCLTLTTNKGFIFRLQGFNTKEEAEKK